MGKKLISTFSLFFGLSLLLSTGAFAADQSKKINELSKRIEVLEKEAKEQKEVGLELKELKEAFDHITFGGGITGVMQGTANNDDNPGQYDNPIDGSYSFDFEVEVDLEKWGTAFMHFEGGDGSGVTDELEYALTGVNADALGEDENTAELVEAYWQFSFLDDMFTFTAGKVDPTGLFDANAVANDEATQFFADIFVNNICMEWPDYTPGFHLKASFDELVDLHVGILSADDDWEDLFEDVFTVAEIDFKPVLDGLQGNYRFYVWMNAQDHVEWDDFDRGVFKDDEENTGFGLSFDQMVTPDITLFCRFGWQDGDIAGESIDMYSELEPFAMEYSWSAGGQITGSLWRRPDDIVGIALGQAILSDDYEDLLKDEGIDTEDESHLELYYSLCLNENVAVTADYQLIDSMGGADDMDAVSVFGIRVQLTF